MSDGRSSYLTVGQAYDLNLACIPLNQAGWHTYQVGSSLHRPDYRDVDLRCIMADENYDAVIGDNKAKLRLLNRSISEWLQARTGLPIDFQFQRMTECNKEFDGPRNFMGMIERP